MHREAFHIINIEMSFSNISVTRITHVVERERAVPSVPTWQSLSCDLSVYKLTVRCITDLHVVNYEALWDTLGTCLCLED